MSKLTDLTIKELNIGYDKKEFKASEVTEAYLKNIDASSNLNAYITVTADEAMAQSKLSDERIGKGSRLSKMDGVPIGVKDLFCTKDIRTTAASHILDDFVPPYESTVTSQLLTAGSIFLGKTNLDEFAMGGANLTSYFGEAINPIKRATDNKEVVTGGSSGGSAASVAGGLAAGSLGTDTGGSIRQPAAFTGIVGLKPTYGRCSRFGIIAYASSLDQAGPMCKTVEDTAIMLNHMAGFDENDSTSVDIAVPDFTNGICDGVKGMKIGIPKELLNENIDKDIEQSWKDKAVRILKDAGAEIVEISLPNLKYALATYYILAPAEASSNLARYDGVRFGLRVDGDTLDDMYLNTRTAGFGEEVKRRIMVGTYVLSAGYYDAYYLKALKVQKLIRQDYLNVFKDVDLIMTPTTPMPAFTVEESKSFDPITMYLQDIFTVPINLARLPAISVPIALSSTEKLPIGIQLVGRDFDEATILKAAKVIEGAK